MSAEDPLDHEPSGDPDLFEYQRQQVLAGIKDAKEGRYIECREMRNQLRTLKSKPHNSVPPSAQG